MLESNKSFSVKLAYLGMKNTPAIGFNIHRLWKYKVAPRIKVFAWLTYHNRILTADNLARRGWHLPSICFLCKRTCETVHHLFSECVIMLELYKEVEGRVTVQKHDWKVEFRRVEDKEWIVSKGGDKIHK